MYRTFILKRIKKSGIYILLLLFLIQGCAFSQEEKKVVYITKTGEKYHTEYCQHLRNSSIEIDLTEAKERGYTPCSVCKPGNGPSKTDSAKTNSSPTTLKAEPVKKTQTTTTSSSQCSATTKAGSRCKRMTTAANGKCWQHQ
jgi:hypothetical protein